MNPIKWLRKNQRKVMTVFVIVIMISFVGGTGLSVFLKNLNNPDKEAIGKYGPKQNSKITREMYNASESQLSLLKQMFADQYLMATSRGNINGMLLIKMLFPDSAMIAQLPEQLKQAAQQDQLPVSVEEVEAYFNQAPATPSIMWFLLKEEAYQAGCLVSNQQAKETLRIMIPQLNIPGPDGKAKDAAKFISELSLSSGATESVIIRAFADLQSIQLYCQKVMNNHAVTLNEVRAEISRTSEKINTEYVKINSAPLVDKNATFSDAEINTQFEAFKTIVAGEPTTENPYGFGYKIPKRVQLEYMVVKMDDVKTLIKKPTSEEMEEYYSRNLQQFTKEEPVDAAKPDGEKKKVTKSFPEVIEDIRQAIEDDKTQKMANMIFNDAKDMTQAGLDKLEMDTATAQDLQKAAGDYQAAADKLSAKHNIKIYTGKTGFLTPEMFGKDFNLRMLGIIGANGQGVSLSDVAFYTGTIAKPEQQKIGVPYFRTWQNIGPTFSHKNSEIKALVRVVDIKDTEVPADINVAFDKKGIEIEAPAEPTKPYAVKDAVTADLKTLKAMDIAKTRTDELVAIVDADGWDNAIKSYNDKFAKDPNDFAMKIRLQSEKAQSRISKDDIAAAKIRIAMYPAYASMFQNQINKSLLNNRLFDLLPEGREQITNVTDVIKLEADKSYCVVRSIERQPATEKDYEDNKVMTTMQLSMKESAPLSLVQLSPENIKARMNYTQIDTNKNKDSKDGEK